MKVLHYFLLAVALCTVAMIGCSGDPPTLDRLQTAEGKIQIISPDQNSILVAGRVEEVIWVTTSHKPIWSYRVFLCDDTSTNDREMLGNAQVLPNLVLYHGILSPGLNGTYTIRVEAYGPGPNAVMLLSATSEPFTIIPSFQGSGGNVEATVSSPTTEDVWYTDDMTGGYLVYVFDSEQCPVSQFQANCYLSDGDGSWQYIPDLSAGWGQDGLLGGGMYIPSNLKGENYQLRFEIWTLYGMFMLTSDVSEPFAIERRNTGIFSISEPNQQTVWENSGIGTVSGYLVDKNDMPVTGPVKIEFRVYPVNPTEFMFRIQSYGWGIPDFTFFPAGDGIIYCDNGKCSWDIQIPLGYLEDDSTDSYQLYVVVRSADGQHLLSVATSEPFTIQ